MRIDFVTLFPKIIEDFMAESIVGRARRKGHLQICTHQLRDFAPGKNKNVDDCPYGGGKGMLLRAEPIGICLDKIEEHIGEKPYTIYLSPKGSVLNQEKVKELSLKKNICLLCGHYEGIDERIIESYVDEEISVGDFVLTGGEMPALILADSVSRMVKGVLSADVCFEEESHFDGLLEYPQYTRPADWRGLKVPDVLTEGHHAKIEKWKREIAIKNTAVLRPDMIKKAVELGKLDKKEIATAYSYIELSEK